MKVTNWRRKLTATLMASGMGVPSLAYAVDIPLGDPSFEDFVIPGGFAYSDTFRPTSAWVDDLDSPSLGNGNPDFYYQDDGNSNWLYNTGYTQTDPTRPVPRTGIQAMHGLGYYNAQETGAVFEAGKTYKFSLWQQADTNAVPGSNGTWMYIFNGNVPFSHVDSISLELKTPAPIGSWSKIDLYHTVLPGAAEIGNPVGVGFSPRSDTAVDDASLSVDTSENVLMYLEVNRTSGEVTLRNQTGSTVYIDYYEIVSANDSLNEAGWNSFQNPANNPSGFPSNDGTGNGWQTAGGSDEGILSESFLNGNSGVLHNASISLGSAFSVGDPEDLVFRYAAVSGAVVNPAGDYNSDGKVDAADYVVWRKTNIGGAGGFTTWRQNFGKVGGPIGPGRLQPGFVRYVTNASGALVPEPATVVIVGIGMAAWGVFGRRKT